MLEVRDVIKTYGIRKGLFAAPGVLTAVDRVSFSLEAGKILGIVGESGSGKTTLGKIIADFIPFDGGQVFWEGKNMREFSPQEWAARAQMIFQDPTASLNPKHSILRLLKEPLIVRARLDGQPLTRAALVAACRKTLAGVGLSGDDGTLHAYPHQFSGGQRQRLAIARALAMKPKLLIADEPVSALDLSIQAQILNLLLDMKESLGLAVLFISHDLAAVSYMADEVIVMRDGRVVERGKTEKILEAPSDDYTRRLLDSVPRALKAS